MTEQEALDRMVAPGTRRPGKYREGVIQIHVTRACDKACFSCTQGSNFGGKPTFISPEHFEQAVLSLNGYFGVVGVFGGNPAMHPQFPELCEILRRHVPFEQRGLWCNAPRGHGKVMRETFNPAVSNLNVHLDRRAYIDFKTDWPESRPFGHDTDSRHSPVYVAMSDLGIDEAKRWELISDCDINKHWSAMIGVFRGQLRAWFCEIAGAQAMLHQDDPEYPDTGMFLDPMGQEFGPWWKQPMTSFRDQVRKHCHECGVPLRGYGQLAQANDGVEQVSETHAGVGRPKRIGRSVEKVTHLEQLNVGRLQKITDYVGELTTMRAALVSVDYTDFLKLTLPYNRHHFDEVTVITAPDDSDKVEEVCARADARMMVTNLFYSDGADFNKWAALEWGLDRIGRTGWLCIMDADVLWPKHLPEIYFERGFLYTPRRRMLEDPTPCIPEEREWGKFPLHRQEREFAGYSQIFHAEDPVLGPPPWHQIDWKHAGGADSFFQAKWPESKKIRPPFEVLHLGPAGVNWCGRSTKLLDGTYPEGANERRAKVHQYLRERRGKAGESRFSHERIQHGRSVP